MSDFPLQRIVDFLRAVVPFDTLPEEALNQVVGQMEIAYYPRGEIIIRREDNPPIHLYIIYVGSARITIADDSGKDILVDKRGEGDVFGEASLLNANVALFDITADEDIIAFLLPAETFRELLDGYPTFKRHFSSSLARDIRAAAQPVDAQLPQLAGLTDLTPGMFLMEKRVSDLMVEDVLTCTPDTSIHGAAERMSRLRVASIVIKGEDDIPLGILTDRDLREKIVAKRHNIDAPVSEVMSHPLYTIKPKAHAFDALLDMSRHGVSHLLVTENDHLVGIISDHDFRLEIGSSPVGVIGDIEKSQSVDELIRTRPKIDHVREMLLRQGGSVKKMTQLVSELNDRVTRRLLRLTEQEIEQRGLGRPPFSYCWMVLGSEGRLEQTLRTDQDNALVFVDVPQQDRKEVKQWFIRFSEQVVEGLRRYGFPRCPGGIMASNPRWCQTETEWQKIFIGWVDDPNPLTLRMGSIFFDFRPLYAETPFLETLRTQLHQAIRRNRLFLRFMAKNALYNVPPLGFFRKFVVEKSGEHKNELNLKMKGLTPVVDAARVLALDLGITATNTFDRLKGIYEQNILDKDFHADLREAYGFISYLRISRHLEAKAKGVEPTNFVDPATLNSLQRKMLKESFAVINRLQEMMEFRYQTPFVLEI